MGEADRGAEPPALDNQAAERDRVFVSADLKEIILRRRTAVKAHLDKLHLTEGLNPRQQSRLAAIVLELCAKYGLWQWIPDFEKWVRIDQTWGQGQRNKFAAKVREARAAVDAALSYAGQVSSEPRQNKLFAQTLRARATEQLQAAKKALLEIDLDSAQLSVVSAEPITSQGKAMFTNPQAEATQRLTDYFIQTCGLSKGDADSRTAKIGQTFRWWNAKHSAQAVDATRKRRQRRSHR